MNAALFEDVFEPSPKEQGILFHTFHDRVGDVSFEQCVRTPQGPLDVSLCSAEFPGRCVNQTRKAAPIKRDACPPSRK